MSSTPAKTRKPRITRRQKSGPDRKAVSPAARQRRPKRYQKQWARPTTLAPVGMARLVDKLSDVPAELRERAEQEKEIWIRDFVLEGCKRGQLMACAREVARKKGLPETAIPPYTTLNTWVKRYRAFGLLGLIDPPNAFAGKSKTITGRTADLFEGAMAQGMTGTRVLQYLAEVLGPLDRLPKRSAIYRAEKQFEKDNAALVALARKGPTWFRDKFEIALSHGVLPGGMRISIDSTVADIWVRIPDARQEAQWRAVRPVFTVVQDVGSRLFVTFNFAFSAIDADICKAVLGRALDPRYNYPGLLSIGVPHEITLDKGAEHQGTFRTLLDTLRIRVVPRHNDSPKAGAHVERLIGTITTEVFKGLTGYSKAERVFDPYAPSDRDTKRNAAQLKYDAFKHEVPVWALPTIEELEARVLAWATVYNERPHAGLPVADPAIQSTLQGVRRLVAGESSATSTDAATAGGTQEAA